MAKIPFDIKYRPQIESGEYKVETRDHVSVTILEWDNHIHGMSHRMLGRFNDKIDFWDTKGRYNDVAHDCNLDLFLVTPEPELSEFEDVFGRAMMEVPEPEEKEEWYPFLKEKAAELLSLAIDARAKELSEGLKQSKLDKDSIPYHLIEFMCNLYTCQNWKEIEETAELYATRIKAAAMKDLPRWNESRGIYRDGWINDGFLYYKNHSIQLSSLEKLPGFKDD